MKKKLNCIAPAISIEDMRKLWEAIDAGDKDAEIAMVYIYTGFRAAELLDIKKENVNMESRIMVGGHKLEVGTNRHVPIHTCIMPFVERLMSAPGEYLISGNGEHGKMDIDYFRKYHWKPLMQRLGMAHSIHECRHACNSMMRVAGFREDVKNIILGLSRNGMEGLYVHYTDNALVETIDKLPGR